MRIFQYIYCAEQRNGNDKKNEDEYYIFQQKIVKTSVYDKQFGSLLQKKNEMISFQTYNEKFSFDLTSKNNNSI